MADKTVLHPGPDHPITVRANPRRVIVTAGGRIVANTANALTLQEAHYPAVQYIPMADVDQSQLEPSDTESHCPYKGDASYFSIPSAGTAAQDALWVYESPYEAVAQIKNHV